MADLWGGKSFLFGTLQEGNSNQSLKAQPRKGNGKAAGDGEKRNTHGDENDLLVILDR